MPRVVDADARRSELAGAAARVIARLGIGGASMREVATEAGWTTGTLVHYFSNKRELLQFTLQASLDQRRSRRADRAALEPNEALRETLVGALPLDEESTLHWIVTVAFCAQASGDPALGQLQRDAYREFRDNVAELVVASGRGSADSAASPTTIAERLIAAANGIAMQALFDPEHWIPQRQLDALDDALVSPTSPAD